MIILDGPNTELRAEVARRLVGFGFKLAELTRTDLHYLILWAHQDHGKTIVDGWPVDHLDPEERHMLASALMPQGMVVVYCADGEATPEHIAELQERLFSSLMTHGFGVAPGFVEEVVPPLQEVHAGLLEVARQYADFPCAINHVGAEVMLVGEASQSLDTGCKRRAFVSATGCSRFLHEALLLNGKTSYYLTNAQKTGRDASDRLTLQREIELVRPRKIVALGTEAAAVLSDLRVPFERTFHPQYWARFRRKHLGEFARILQ